MAAKEPRENILARIKERQAAARKKRVRRIIKVCGGLAVLVAVLAILYPYLQVVWHTSKARGNDPDTRKAALQWLADREVRSATGIFVEALNSTHGESKIAERALRQFKDTSILPDLLKIWNDKTAKAYARYNALQLIAELGDKSHENVFIDPLAILSDRGWESSYDFLDMYADEKTLEKLLAMLGSGDARQERAAATALRYIREKPFIEDSEEVKSALAAKLSSSEVKVRQETAHALSEMAGEKQFPQLVAALDDEDPAVCCFAVMAIGRLKPEVAAKALPRLLEKLLHPDGDICTAAAGSIINVGAAQALPRLVEILSDKQTDSFSRAKVVGILKTVADPKAVEAITNALADPKANVAKAAAVALIRVGGRDSVGPLVSTLNTTGYESLQVVVAFALGMLAQKEAAPALVSAMKKGNPDLTRAAGEALLKAGAREYAPELALILQDTRAFPVSRREALIILSQFRALLSVEMTVDALSDELEGVREEAANAAKQLSADLLASGKQDLEAARAVLVEAAGFMLQKGIGKELGDSLGGAKSFDQMNQTMFAAMRRLDEKNTHDFDLLERTLARAKGIYWTSLLRGEFAKRGLSQEQLAQAAGALREYVVSTFIPMEIPTGGHVEMGAMLRKRFGFQEAQDDE
jgi:HEAT repeat protein